MYESICILCKASYTSNVKEQRKDKKEVGTKLVIEYVFSYVEYVRIWKIILVCITCGNF